jgi:hypothetical protein
MWDLIVHLVGSKPIWDLIWPPIGNESMVGFDSTDIENVSQCGIR